MSRIPDMDVFAAVFRAAADGVMGKYEPPERGWGEPFMASARDRDAAIAGAFRAVGDVFAKIAEAERVERIALIASASVTATGPADV